MTIPMSLEQHSDGSGCEQPVDWAAIRRTMLDKRSKAELVKLVSYLERKITRLETQREEALSLADRILEQAHRIKS